MRPDQAIEAQRNDRWATRFGVVLSLLAIGIVSLAWLYPGAFSFSTAEEALFGASYDRAQHWIGLYAAMLDPIDWSRPFAIANLEYPVGTTLFLVDAIPIVSLPVRLLVQLLGASIEPTVPLSLWASVCFALGPLSLYRLARTLGAGRAPALISGLLSITIPPFVEYLLAGWEALAGWSLLALLIAELIEAERGRLGAARLAFIALLSLLLGWSSAYLGTMAIALTLSASVRGLVMRRPPLRSLLLAAIAVAPALSALALGGAGGDLLGAPSLGGRGALPGLGSLRIAGLSPVEPIGDWGLIIALMLAGAAFRIARSTGAVGWVSLAMGLFSLGSLESGGLLPERFYAAFPPAGLLYVTSRFLTPVTLLSIALAPLLMVETARRLLPRGRLLAGPVIGLLVIGSLLEADAVAGVRASGTPRDPTPASEPLALLVAEHRLVWPEPQFRCASAYQIEPEEAKRLFEIGIGMTLRLAYHAVDSGGAIESYYLARLPADVRCTDRMIPREGTLVVRYGGAATIERATFEPLPDEYRCVDIGSEAIFPTLESRLPVRLCSTNIQAIGTFAARLSRPLLAPSAPWPSSDRP